MIERTIAALSPSWALKRAQARKVLRTYQGAEANRLTNGARPKNRSADQELLGPFGADAARAWGRAFARDNAYAWGVEDTIVSSVVGNGINCQSVVETPEGQDVEPVNDRRDALFAEWCEVCEINGQYNFAEIQAICQREIVEAGEVFVRKIATNGKTSGGINRPVPLAIELIEADRIATDRDTFAGRGTDNRIIRGVEIDKFGKPVAYWVYKSHPDSLHTVRQEPERIPASEILHLFRRDRIGQTRGVTWFAPVMSWLRDLAIYVDNEIQAIAVASCFGVVIKTDSPGGSLAAPEGQCTTDTNGNRLTSLEPAMVSEIGTNESIEVINPGRPNSAAEPWINLILRGIAVGTGLSYEVVSRNYSGTSYSSSRTSMLEDRRRFRRWQRYLVDHLCQPIWDEFCNAAARESVEGFPTSSELLDARRTVAPVEWQTPEWEWVDPQSEQAAAKDSVASNMSTLQYQTGLRGGNWRSNMYQRAKEEELRKKLRLFTPEELASQAQAPLGLPAPGEPPVSQPGTSELAGMSRLQQKRNTTGIEQTLDKFIAGAISEAKARVYLSTYSLSPANIDALIADASDGSIDSQIPEDGESEALLRSIVRDWVTTDDGNHLYLDKGGSGLKTSPAGAKVGSAAPKSHGVTLPSKPSKLNISTASEAMDQMGYKLGESSVDLKAKKTSYEVTHPDGSKSKMTTDELKKLVYDGAKT